MANGQDKPSVLGKSLELANGDLAIVDGQLKLIRDRDNFLQAMQIMIETPMGSDIFNVSYGFDLLNAISSPQSVSFIKDLIRLNIIKSLGQDDRVREIKEIAFSDEPRFSQISPEFDSDQSNKLRKQSRQWQAVVVLQTITEGDVALSLAGRGI